MSPATGGPTVAPAYFDAALVAKFYLNEPGRDAVRRLARTSGVVVSPGIAVAEVSAASRRRSLGSTAESSFDRWTRSTS